MTTTFDLGSLTPGDVAQVVRIDGEDLLAGRLEAAGFWPGTTVSVVRCAPLGGPIQYRLRGFRLALRRNEAQRVLVRRVDAES